MTTLAISAYACRFCDAVASFFKTTFKRIRFGLQMSANRKVAQELCSLGFHQQKEFSQILQRMNDRAVEEYYGKK
mgnify:CR=1 FL=1|tara:strand:+ start:305 stop:529 length:225 start_codon:yes stop_codon:yes gene_type:complete